MKNRLIDKILAATDAERQVLANTFAQELRKFGFTVSWDIYIERLGHTLALYNLDTLWAILDANSGEVLLPKRGEGVDTILHILEAEE